MLGKFPDGLLREIAEQPDAMRRAAAGLRGIEAALAELAARSGQGSIVFTGMGGSYHACYPAVTVLAGAGVRAEMIDAAELLHFRRARIVPGDIVVGVSQSGESAETVRVFAALRSQPARPSLVSVTNGLDNRLCRLADVGLDTCAGAEEGPSTITFAAALMTLAAVVDAVQGRWNSRRGARLRADAEAAARAIEAMVANGMPRADELRRWLGDRSILVVVARGTARAAAEMGALTLKETARFPAEALQAAQFRHGPLELVGPETAVLVIGIEAETRDLDARLAADVAAAGGTVLLVGADGAPVNGTKPMTPKRLNRLLAPAAAVVPCQLLAWKLAQERGLSPGSMRHATKVTTSE